MPFPICKGSNVCVLESFQHIDELAYIQNCDKCDQKHANWWKAVLIRFFLFVFPPRWFISGCFCLSCVIFLHAFNSLFGSASIHYSAELQPALTRLKSQLIAPFLWKRLVFFHFSVSREFVAVLLIFWADLIQFRLKTEKRADTSSFSCGWLLIGDALCTFLKSHLQVLPQRWCFVLLIGMRHSLCETKHLISIFVGWWHQTDKSWSILISNINETSILPSKHIVHKPFVDTGVL